MLKGGSSLNMATRSLKFLAVCLDISQFYGEFCINRMPRKNAQKNSIKNQKHRWIKREKCRKLIFSLLDGDFKTEISL